MPRQARWASSKTYENAQLVLYAGAVSTAGCGGATSAFGLFYCPADEHVYLDLSFYEDMRRQLGAPGDFASAYVSFTHGSSEQRRRWFEAGYESGDAAACDTFAPDEV